MDYRLVSQIPAPTWVRCLFPLAAVLTVWSLLHGYLMCRLPSGRVYTPSGVSQDSRSGKRHLVYDCSSAPCGGWADRLEGITTAYLIALATGRDFHINLTYPVDIRGFLEANEVNWGIDQLELHDRSTRYYGYMDNREFCHSLKHTDFDKSHPEDVVRLRMNVIGSHYLNQNARYRRQLLPFLNKSLSSTFSTVHRQLFKFSNELNRRLSAFRNALKSDQPSKLVCAQIRTGYALESIHFVDRRDLERYWEFFNKAIQAAGNIRIFVASDSYEVVVETSHRFGSRVVIVDGHIDHTDKSDRKDVVGGFWKTLTDFYALAMCDTLVLSRKSSFGRLPAFLRGRDDGLYIFQNHQIQRASLKDIENEYLQRVVL